MALGQERVGESEGRARCSQARCRKSPDQCYCGCGGFPSQAMTEAVLSLTSKIAIAGVQTPGTNYFKSTCSALGALF